MTAATFEPRPPPAGTRRVRAGCRVACSTRRCCGSRLRTRSASSTRATLYKNPVMFIVEIGSVWTTWLAIRDHTSFAIITTIWLWLTVLFANLAEAVAEGRGKAQAETLRRAKTDDHGPAAGTAGRPARPRLAARSEWSPRRSCSRTSSSWSRPARSIPGDGDVVDGIASVDESAITGESAPVIRESGGDRSSVTGGTRVLSDRIVVQITQKPGESFIDRMIALVEGASRQKTPNEIALNILLASLTIIFLLAVATLQPFAIFAKAQQPGVPNSLGADDQRRHRHRPRLAAGLPDPDHDRRAALRDRHRRHGPARAAQRAGDVRSRGRGGR